MATKEAKENDDKRHDAESPAQTPGPFGEKRYPRLESLALPGPWTEQDEVWFKWMTGETQRREQREAVERELDESDL
jgi:hypothetical protein